MLAVPLKVTEPVDFVAPLSAYIADNYSEQVSEETYVTSLSALNALREQCTFDAAAQKSTDVATQDKQRQALLQYYAQVCAMQAKFPISASSASA